jgi:hypothetical protein
MLADLVKIGIPGAIIAAGFLILGWLGKPKAGQYGKAMGFAIVMVLSLLGALLTYVWLDPARAVALGTVTPPDEFQKAFNSVPYAIEQANFHLNFSGWKEVSDQEIKIKKVSRVAITRHELILKNAESMDKFEYQFWTTGVGIDPIELRSHAPVSYSYDKTEVKDGKEKRLYKLEVPMNGLKAGSRTTLDTKFQFWNGFQGATKEDWRARIQYPTRTVAISIQFPKEKKISKPIAVWLTDENGIKEKELSAENPVLVHHDGDNDIAQWSGLNVPGRHLIFFEWEWENIADAKAG